MTPPTTQSDSDNASILHIRKIFLIGNLSFLAIGLVIAIISYLHGDIRDGSINSALINFTICDEHQSPIKPPIVKVGTDISACGYFLSKTNEPLNVYWYHLPEKTLFFYNDDEEFSQGLFESKLGDRLTEPGNYRVVVYYFRNILASEEFEVIP